MLDDTNVAQQEALGVIGVNLIYGAFYHTQPERLDRIALRKSGRRDASRWT